MQGKSLAFISVPLFDGVNLTIERGEKVGLSAASLGSMIILIQESFASGSLRWAFWAGPPLDRPVRYRFEVKSPVPKY